MREDQQMKALLKSLKNNKHMFAVPEPDADFERRMVKGLRESKAWNKVSLWDRLNIFRFEFTVWRLAGATCAVLLAFGSLQYYNGAQSDQFANNDRRSHPELTSMLQRGGAKALQAWIVINGDMTAQNSPDTVENAPVSDQEQKRILAELEKKWAPAL